VFVFSAQGTIEASPENYLAGKDNRRCMLQQSGLRAEKRITGDDPLAPYIYIYIYIYRERERERERERRAI
jgi:hypothetical protein